MCNNIIDQFETDLLGLCGNVCWGVLQAVEAGSTLSLHIGSKIRRTDPVALSSGKKMFEGLFGFLIDCAWRVEIGSEVVGGSYDYDSVKNDPTPYCSEKLRGRTISTVCSELPGLDLVIEFDGDVKLRIFCSETDVVSDNDNYTLYTPHRIYRICAASKLKVSLRE